MIATLEAAVCDSLGALPGVATCRPYAGDLAGQVRATLRVPALLVTPARLRILPDLGTGELHARVYLSVFCCTRHADRPEARGQTAWALAEQVLVRARANTWGLAKVSPALMLPADRLEDAAVALPLWDLEDRELAVREVRWTHDVRIGAAEWDGDGVAPSEVWLGIAPRIWEMGGTAEDYWRVDALPGGSAG